MAKRGNGAGADRNSRTAVAYFRTSSAANVGAGKDTVRRQRDAVTAYAEAHVVEYRLGLLHGSRRLLTSGEPS